MKKKSKNPSGRKVVAKYTGREIVAAIRNAYAKYGGPDSWGVQVIYQDSLEAKVMQWLRSNRATITYKSK